MVQPARRAAQGRGVLDRARRDLLRLGLRARPRAEPVRRERLGDRRDRGAAHRRADHREVLPGDGAAVRRPLARLQPRAPLSAVVAGALRVRQQRVLRRHARGPLIERRHARAQRGQRERGRRAERWRTELPDHRRERCGAGVVELVAGDDRLPGPRAGHGHADRSEPADHLPAEGRRLPRQSALHQSRRHAARRERAELRRLHPRRDLARDADVMASRGAQGAGLCGADVCVRLI